MAEQRTRRKQNRTPVNVQTARQELRDYITRVQYHGERIVITRYGEEAAALVSIADLEKLEGAA